MEKLMRILAACAAATMLTLAYSSSTSFGRLLWNFAAVCWVMVLVREK